LFGEISWRRLRGNKSINQISSWKSLVRIKYRWLPIANGDCCAATHNDSFKVKYANLSAFIFRASLSVTSVVKCFSFGSKNRDHIFIV
jgi:hypothetical protein